MKISLLSHLLLASLVMSLTTHLLHACPTRAGKRALANNENLAITHEAIAPGAVQYMTGTTIKKTRARARSRQQKQAAATTATHAS